MVFSPDAKGFALVWSADDPDIQMRTAIETKGFSLHDWQLAAVDAWVTGHGGIPYRGTLEVFTGGGKSLIALECFARVAMACEGLQLAVVVPTEALVDQWVENVVRHTNISRELIGRLGGGCSDTFSDRQVLICVLNTASNRLPGLVRDGEATMLVVDECHRAGAPTFSRVLNTPARFRLGLSATPEREELDEDGAQIEYDEQLVAQSLGGLVFRFTLRDARRLNWLPDYAVHHHAVELIPAEREQYDMQTRKIDDLADRLAEHGIDLGRVRQASARTGEPARLAHAYLAATSQRKDLLYRASERSRVVVEITRHIRARRQEPRILLFHERVDEAAMLHARMKQEFPTTGIALEHARLSTGERKRALASFKDNTVSILVSVKALVEGIDVPDADVGISVAASSSVRQRVQSLGRVLRRSFNEKVKNAEMHIIYIANTVDEVIYAKEDWTDLTGSDVNQYWRWPLSQAAPIEQAGAPRTPAPSEMQEWDRLGQTVPSAPQPWHGLNPNTEYTVDVNGNVFTPFERRVINPQGVGKMVLAVRGKPGGRFGVTPLFRLVIVRALDGKAFVAGQLAEAFTIADDTRSDHTDVVAVEHLSPGDVYPGPADKSRGSYRLSQKRGGVIERRDARSRSAEFALLSDTRTPMLEGNARRVLDAWRRVMTTGIEFHLSREWHAWYLKDGEPRFLAEATGGFAWPSSEIADELPQRRSDE